MSGSSLLSLCRIIYLECVHVLLVVEITGDLKILYQVTGAKRE